MKKSIAILVNHLSNGGAERVISRISKPLSEYYNVYLLVLSDLKTQMYECEGEIVDIGGGKRKYWQKVLYAHRNINKFIKAKRIECVISFLDIPNLLNVMSVKKCKSIISLRCYVKEESYCGLTSKVNHALCRSLFRRADKVISVSKVLEEKSISYFKLRKERVCTIENPYDIQEIAVCAMEEIEDEVLKFIVKHKTSIAVGRLDEQKGYPLLLECFRKLCETEEQAGLIILGAGELELQLRGIVEKLGIEDKVLFLGRKKNPFAYVARCKLYVSASRFEGFPNALVEAMACGIPVLHTDCLTGPREILSLKKEETILQSIEYADYGVLVPDFDRIEQMDIALEQAIGCFAKAWGDLLSNEQLTREYGAVAYKRAQEYSVGRCVQKYCEVIGEVIKNDK